MENKNMNMHAKDISQSLAKKKVSNHLIDYKVSIL
jgi:hypothetical protein